MGVGSSIFDTSTGDDDEDGVSFFTSVSRIGVATYVDVLAHAACDLSAWIDYN